MRHSPLDSKKLTEDAINGILSKLDPHSAYTNASDTKKFTEPLEGSFEGIGVQFNILEDTLLVIQPVPKGPSEKVGILAGDRIVSVADTAIAGVKMSREEIMHRLRGPKGTIARLGVVRRGIQDTLRFNVKRDRIPVNSVDAAYMVTPTIGLIRFNNFGQTTHNDTSMQYPCTNASWKFLAKVLANKWVKESLEQKCKLNSSTTDLYSGYIRREKEIAEKIQRLENIRIKGRLNYEDIKSLSTEARQKLAKIDPETMAQASRIPGVSPSDINVLLTRTSR